MNQSQLDFYNKLSDTEKLILKAAALKVNCNYSSDITDLLVYRQKISQKIVIDTLDQAAKHLLFRYSVGYGSRKTYEVNSDFLVFILPQLSDFDVEWKMISIKPLYNFNNYDPKLELRNFLYSLFHNNAKFAEYQERIIRYGIDTYTFKLVDILDNAAYDEKLAFIDLRILNAIILIKINQLLSELEQLDKVKQFIEKIKTHLSPELARKITSIDDTSAFVNGLFNERDVEKLNIEQQLYHLAIIQLTQENYKNALSDFDKGIKAERVQFKNIQIPSNLFESFFYFTTLLCIDAETASARAQKMLKSIEKNSFSSFDYYFKTILYNIVNDTSAKKGVIDFMMKYIREEHNDLQSLLFLCISYLADAKPNAGLEKAMLKLVNIAHNNGYRILAYEAAYALKTWFNSTACVQLYNDIASTMAYKSVFSNIQRQEEWEKSLNLLLSMGLDTSKTSSGKDTENKNRVVYYFSQKTNAIQPVLQTRTAKNGWSSGRNIAMKTFFGGNVAGMTEQDFRIAKSIKRYSNYYDGDYYEFTDKTLKELIGHPYIFLNGTTDVGVEFTAALPEIKVTKSANGYALKIDIEPTTESILLVKETNTRYNVYDLTSQQRNIINILSQQKILVPEQGKDKLIQLLGGFSKHVTVHSDLLASKDSLVNVKTVESDNRIRVQLLPFGDGLKAEIFAKPFGDHPPYCKPGVGGKVLVANEKGLQLQVKRDLKKETEIANILLSDFQSLESIDMSDDLISFSEPLDSLYLLDVISNHKDICVVEWPEGERFKIKAAAGISNLNMRIKTKTNWFELEGELKVNEDTVLTMQQLMDLVVKSKTRFVELKDGEFLALSTELKKRLDELYTFTTKGKSGLQMNKFASVALGDFFDDFDKLKADKSWTEFRQRIQNIDLKEAKIPDALQAELRPYQEDGFRWMARLAAWDGGACLADDMGLGKTVQTIAILLHRSAKGAALVVCPVSVLGNWIAELQRFAPTLNVKTLSTSNREQTLQLLESNDVLITSYGLLQSEEKLFAEVEFATVVLDEAHVIKNYATKTSKAIMQLKSSFRVALTGTPLQNHLGEIWNLFNFVNPGLLGSIQHFNDSFVKPDNDYARKMLRKLVAPFILRRTKSSVLDELPPKTEIVKKIQLSEAEMAFYENLRRQAVLNLESGEGNQGMKHLQVLAEITKLRQASCNPALVDANIKIESSKLSTFLEIVEELIENKHRALVFSQFVSHLSIVREALNKKGINYQYLDGSTPIAERERSVKKFQSGEGELFLISLKAGGLGLNLTAADYVIHMDPWWNPAVEDQASDRAHRIGQMRPVTIYRLVAENTIEEKIIQLHHLKRDLANALLEGSDQSAQLSFHELVALIQGGE